MISAAPRKDGVSPAMVRVFESASALQELVPDAVLVGGSAAALYAKHRESLDYDHLLTDLVDRYDAVVEAVEASDGWATSVRSSKPPATLMGSLFGVEAGLRQLRRAQPLETQSVEVSPGHSVVVPTEPEILRVKAYLVVQRGAVRDFLDVVALADRVGPDTAHAVLGGIDGYYRDRSGEGESVLTALVSALGDPQPSDPAVLPDLARYKGLVAEYHDWSAVRQRCLVLALALAGVE